LEKRLVSPAVPLPADELVDARPGDHAVATAGDAWLRAYAANRDPVLREQIILAYLGLADRIAYRYRNSPGSALDDLTQTARAGLIAAVDRYDPAKGAAFVPFAVASVVGELKRYLRDTSWRLHVPRTGKERVLRLYRAIDELHQVLGRAATLRELACHLQMTETELLETWEAAQTRIGLSLDRLAGDNADLSLGDLLAAPGPDQEPEDVLTLHGLIGELPELERRVIVMRFYQDLNQKAIAARIGYSQMHVSRLLRRALARMRAQLLAT
jgi:RNA polymerase sigma-B factor